MWNQISPILILQGPKPVTLPLLPLFFLEALANQNILLGLISYCARQ